MYIGLDVPSALWKVEISVENCFIISWHCSSNVALNLWTLLKTLTNDAREAGYYTLRRKQFFCKFFRNKVLIIAWDSIARNVWVTLSTSRFTNRRTNVVKIVNRTKSWNLMFYFKVQTADAENITKYKREWIKCVVRRDMGQCLFCQHSGPRFWTDEDSPGSDVIISVLLRGWPISMV